MTKKNKNIPTHRAWDPIDLPKQAGFITNDRSGKKIYIGKGRRKDIPLNVLDRFVDENKHKVIGSLTKHTESEHKIEKTVIHTTPRLGVEKRLTTPTVPSKIRKRKKKKKLTPEFDFMNKPAPFKKGDRILHTTTSIPGVVIKQVLYLNNGKWVWTNPLVLLDNGQEQIIPEQELVKIK